MGITTWPCPVCGQQQSETHQNGSQPVRFLCAECKQDADHFGKSEAQWIVHAFKAKEKGNRHRDDVADDGA